MSQSLNGRRILLIISGGIAAYKSLDLIRKLKDEGAHVQGLLTEGGAQFITDLSVTALSGMPCMTKLFANDDEKQFDHIRLTRECDLVVIAPATANLMAKMAHGLADNLASAVLLATDKPVLIAPAMNSMMWNHPATQANMTTLASRGVKQVGPESGHLACGEEGAGRMSQPEAILQSIKDHFEPTGPLAGKKIIVTSGPTYEPLDPVRFLGNRSSGKQGHAIAQACAALGAEVTLISGPTSLPDPSNIKTVHIETAIQMLEACKAALPADCAICAAAVADWRPVQAQHSKIKKEEGETSPTFSLTENPDILATLSKGKDGIRRPALVIGFAAETDAVERYAQDKITRKGCDWILANSVKDGDTFGQDDNQVVFLTQNPDDKAAWPKCSKLGIAQKLADKIAEFFG